MKKIAVVLLFVFCYYGKVAAEEIQWMVNDASGNPCLIAEMTIKANFSYNVSDSTNVKNILYEIPTNLTKVNVEKSKCDKEQNQLTVDWSIGSSFEILFSKKNTSYELSSLTITINTTDIFKDSLANETITLQYKPPALNDSSFETPANFSFHCNREQTLNSSKINDESYILLSQVQFEAFKSDKSKKFSLAKDCESNFKPDIVPIAVGLSLISLIVIVLIAYIVGRRRQQARGYLNIM